MYRCFDGRGGVIQGTFHHLNVEFLEALHRGYVTPGSATPAGVWFKLHGTWGPPMALTSADRETWPDQPMATRRRAIEKAVARLIAAPTSVGHAISAPDRPTFPMAEAIFGIRSDGATVREPHRKAVGTAAVKAEKVVIHYQGDRIERWARVGRRMVVEHWFPIASYPTEPPVLGIAERLR